jgi:hypothetical protein
MGLKLYRNGTLLGSILSKLVLGSPKDRTPPSVDLAGDTSPEDLVEETYDCNSVSLTQPIDVKTDEILTR